MFPHPPLSFLGPPPAPEMVVGASTQTIRRYRCTRAAASGRHVRALGRRRVQEKDNMHTGCEHGTSGRGVHVTSRREVARPAVAETTTAAAAAAAASTADVAAKSTAAAAAVTGATVPLVWLRALIGIATVAVIIFQGSHVTFARTHAFFLLRRERHQPP